MSSSTPHKARRRRTDSLAAAGESPPDADVTLAPPPRKKAAARRTAVSDGAQPPPPANAPARRGRAKLQAVDAPAGESAAASAPQPGRGPQGSRKPRRSKPADDIASTTPGSSLSPSIPSVPSVPFDTAAVPPGAPDPTPAAHVEAASAIEPKKRNARAKADAAAKTKAPATKRRRVPRPTPEPAQVVITSEPLADAAAEEGEEFAPEAAQPSTAAAPAAIEERAEAVFTPPQGPVPAASGAVAATSRLWLADGDAAAVVWQPAAACPQALAAAALDGFDALGRPTSDDDAAVAHLLSTAAACGHAVEVDARIWPYLAARRDARRRLAVLQTAYPEGAADPGLDDLLHVALAPFQAEGALWAVVAGRALLADERGLGKGVQAIAAALLWRRHFGLRQVLVVCAASQCAQWRHAWKRWAGIEARVLDRFEDAQAAQWHAEAEVRIVSPGAIAAGALAATPWLPQLAIVDEPQRLALGESDWSVIEAPQMLVLSGAALDAAPALLETLVERLDRHRLGALGALREVQAARREGAALPDAEIERLDARLSSLLLQRQRAEVAEQLPARIWCARLVGLPSNHRSAHERAWRQLSALLAGWRACGWLAIADQWPVAEALGALRAACLRSDPFDGSSPLAEPIIAAIQAQLDEWAADGAGPVALCCASASDRDQLVQRLGARAGLSWVIPGQSVPATAEAVLLAGVPWDDQAYPDAAGSPHGRPWLAVVGDRSFDSGLLDTLVDRRGTPCGPGAGGWLDGEPLRAWLGAIDAALRAAVEVPTETPADKG